MQAMTGETGPNVPGATHVEPGRRPAEDGRRALLLLSLVGGLAVLAVVLTALAPLAPRPVTVRDAAREISLVDWSDLRPEPRERFLYLAGVLLLPFCLLGS